MSERAEMDQPKQIDAGEQTDEMVRLLLEAISDVIWVQDFDTGLLRYISPSVTRLLGYTVEEILAKTTVEVFTPGSYLLIQERSRRRAEAFRQGQRVSYVDELSLVRKDGSLVWTEITTRFQINQTSGRLEVFGVLRDITERRLNGILLRTRLDLVELAPDLALEDFLRLALDRAAEITGSTVGFYHFVEPDQVTISLQAWSTRTLQEFCKAQGSGMHYSLHEAGVWADSIRQRRPVIHNDFAALAGRKGLPPGHAPLFRELVVPVTRGDQVVSVLGVGNKPTDYTERDVGVAAYLADLLWELAKRKQAEQSLGELQARLNLLSQNLEDAGLYVYSHDAQGKPRFEYLSASMETLTGVKTADALRDAWSIHSLILPEYFTRLMEKEEQSRQSLARFEIEIRQKHAITGELQWLLLRSTPRRRPDGSTVWYGVQMDITARKHNEHLLQEANARLSLQMQEIENLHEVLREQSLRDPLTGLYNRRYLSETLGREIARAERENLPLSVVISDIDNFKRINDTYGHQTGDRFLVEIARLMNKNARRSDIVCRYGGEEFLLVLPGTNVESAAKRADEIRRKCMQLNLGQDGKDMRVSMSFGVATYPIHGSEADEIIIKADQALYLSKAAGRNRVRVWYDSASTPQ
jgi:diguanylate cyclase (GGDEF)-like protein/PAS domain S-box-containing protein